MADPQPTDPHLRVAHELVEEILSCDFSKRQLSILLLILRLSWGFHKKWAVIPKQRDFEVAGVIETHVKKELEWLAGARVIIVDGDRYWFNKDYDQWRVSRARCHSRSRLTDLVSTNVKDAKKRSGLKLTKSVSSSGTKQLGGKKDNSIIKEEKDEPEIKKTIIIGEKGVVRKEVTEYPEQVERIISVWFKVDGFKVPINKAAELAAELMEDYPDLDTLEESKGWSAYCLTHPLTAKSAPAQQLRNRMRKAREFKAKGGNHGPARTGARGAGDFSGEW